MEKKIYSSYDEINRDLEILNLERKLHYDKIKQSIDDLKENLTLPNLAMGLLDISKEDTKPLVTTVFKAVVPFLVKKVLNFFSK